MEARTTKLFRSGRFQAVRLPTEYRFEGKEVLIHRDGEAVVLTPVKPWTWPKDFFKRIRITDPSFRRSRQGKAPSVRPTSSSSAES